LKDSELIKLSHENTNVKLKSQQLEQEIQTQKTNYSALEKSLVSLREAIGQRGGDLVAIPQIFESTLPSNSLSFESMSPTKIFAPDQISRSPSYSPEKLGTKTLLEEKENEL